MVDVTPFLPGLSPVHGKAVVARFDGGRLSSEGGLPALREIERRLGVADRLAGCLKDPRMPEKVVHRLAEIIRFRMLMIAAGYEDGNDADTLRDDPMFKLALDRLPSGEGLCSQSTVSRLENLPDLRALLRLGRPLVEQYCGSLRAAPKRIVLDIDDTFDRVHGGQQLRLFNAYYDDYGFQPIVVFDGEGRFVTALLRSGKRPSGVEIRGFVRRLIGAIRAHWPRVEILLRADSHYAAPEVFDWCRADRVDWVFGLAPNTALRRHVAALENSTAARFKTAPTCGKARRFMQFYDAAESWSRVERIIARVEAGPKEPIPASSSPTSKPGAPGIFTSGSTAPAAKPRTTSRRGRTTSPPTALPAIRPRPTSSSVPARRRLLALMVDAPRHAQTLGLARHAVRHLEAAPDQTRRLRRRAENPA
jgi:hypothetical protein